MKRKGMGAALVCALLAALALTLPAAAQFWEEDAAAGDQTVQDSAVRLIPQSRGIHAKYMNGDSQGLFWPDRPVTRAELAQMLDGVVADDPQGTPILFDVPWDAWYVHAVDKAVNLGLLTAQDGWFRPDEPATRAECAAALSLVLPYDVMLTQSFSDVGPEHWAWYAVSRVGSYGLFQGDETGRFRPNDGILRCEIVAVFNRLLGRTPDLAYISQRGDLRAFPDVPSAHWAWGDIMEAAATHQYALDGAGREVWTSAVTTQVPVTTPEPEPPVAAPEPEAAEIREAAGRPDGPQRIDGHLYWVAGEQFIRSCNMDGLYFNENGWYTTGDEELDEMLNALVEELTDESMTRDEKLRALYNYVRDNFRYLKRPLIEKGQTGWEAEYALYFLKNGKGNCYNFSAAYCLLCQELGLPAYCVVGRALDSPHGWVEIQLDGATYMFDTQLEWRYLHDWGKAGYDFFKISPSKTPVKYTR